MTKKISQLDAAATLTGAELIEVSQPSASVTITATTISAAASDQSFNDSGSGFVSAGFAVGDQVRVTGFTGDTDNNIVSGRLTSVAAGKIIIGGSDGSVIVDDAAGEPVTITKWVSRRALLDDLVALLGSVGGDGVLRGDAMDSHPPTANPATLGVLANNLPVLVFDGGSTNENARWIRRLPTSFTGSTLDFTIKCVMASATSGNVRWGVRIQRLDADISADAFDTAAEATQAVSADVDDPTITTISGVSVDGAGAGDEILIDIYRDASDTGNDTATGEARLYAWQAEA